MLFFFVAAYLSSAFTGEVCRQVARGAGILQWHAVPYFETHFRSQLDTLDRSIADVATPRVKGACTSVDDYCDNNRDFSIAKAFFFCSVAVTCTAFKELVEQVSTLLVKRPGFCTPSLSASPGVFFFLHQCLL
ncbi:hypothetical protein TraAM80_00450 [Trypanosoma rangeli]|uniref:Secreted protein n=1 Tax=Trypanosoma rangeli TaxID=5698 RepID=A0A3R7KRH6_TRYRA|nr:uncharacterized protein TraAM80_00450 [Trypanosoma rangeli]RNF12169.1 hypothetical protein TraAM80_00450 [Trypanosoma rangeli]|eukprot:RNF12169.1 hypothetical protein TraAM80_00450 [Trypanosoma rangeli]